MTTPLLQLLDHGQSLWLDYIDRGMLLDGAFETLVEEGVRGVTSNPTIFFKAITRGSAYDDAVRDLVQGDPGIDGERLYHWLMVQDVQMAADVLRPVYDQTEGSDGYVSLEVSPHLAYDTDATVERAHHIWLQVDRPNLMIKVPATREGLPAIERLIGEGINVNATLLFSVPRYRAVAEAYARGLALCADPARVASVASFFVSRIDRKIDALLDAIGSAEAGHLRGRIATASAKVAYQAFKESLDAPPFAERRRHGAHPQRPLWASTSTKDPAYTDLLYVEGLIGSQTVTTVPPETLDALMGHGEVYATLEEEVDRAYDDLDALGPLGIDLDRVTAELEDEGVEKFQESHDQLVAALERKRDDVAKTFAES
ncbi:MAG: transaldolase [Gammaproteobacteria bacterium]|nr:transaldolase [Gammaproteobacteria bacterium]